MNNKSTILPTTSSILNSQEDYNAIPCYMCKKPVKETDRMVAFGEATGVWYPDIGEIDDIEPVLGSWFVSHYFCFFKKKEEK